MLVFKGKNKAVGSLLLFQDDGLGALKAVDLPRITGRYWLAKSAHSPILSIGPAMVP